MTFATGLALLAVCASAAACSTGRDDGSDAAGPVAGSGPTSAGGAAGSVSAGGRAGAATQTGGAGGASPSGFDAGAHAAGAGGAGAGSTALDAAVPSDDAARPDAALGPQDGLTVRVGAGSLQGQLAGATRKFLGVPYAQAPVGTLRFAAPRAVPPWQDTRDATRFGPSCMQGGGLLPDIAEDCLTLNVFAPAASPAAPRPVMVFIHGGGFTIGGSFTYDAQALREAGDIVLVTLNYRLGPFGFFAHPALCDAGEPCSNQGLRDQQLALAWVAENIAVFGGDPRNVTVFGESAGSISACAHMFAKGSEALGQRFILQSGSCVYGPLAVQSEANARAAGQTVAGQLCPGAPDPIACLRGLPAEQIAAVTVATVDPVVDGYWPWVDGYLFPEPLERLLAQGKLAATPLIVGTNRSEWLLWEALGATPRPLGNAALRAEIDRYFPAHAQRIAGHYVPANEFDAGEAFIRMMTDAYFRCPSRALLRGAAAAGSSGYLYEFAVHPAAHALEVDYVFGLTATTLLFPFEAPDPPLPGVVRAMQGHWTQFAATGDPNRSDLPSWPQYSTERAEHVIYDDPAAVGGNLAKAECDLWDELWGG